MNNSSPSLSDRALWPWLVFGAATLALLFRPLLGFGALLPIDIAELFAPWRFNPQSGLSELSNHLLSDTLDVHSHFASLAEDVLRGRQSFWDRSVGAGIPSLKAGLPVFNVAYLIGPAWYAPGLAAAFRAMSAAGLTYGLARRLGVGRACATVSGVAYAFCGFLIGWSGWPQANVAALLPGLFWVAESIAVRPRWRTAVGLAGILAAMLWANFPTITLYGLLFAGIYSIIRSWTNTDSGDRVKGFALRALIAAWGCVMGLGVASYHILHFGENLAWADNGPRERLAADPSIGAEFLPSLVLPEPYGASHDGGVFWATSLNEVEVQSYAGLTVFLLALVALVGRKADSGTSFAAPVRIWWILVVAAVWLTYIGGPPTAFLNSFSIVSFSSIGRARVIANLGIAVLAGLGMQTWIDAHHGKAVPDIGRRLRLVSIGVVGVGALITPFLWSWFRITRDRGFLREALSAGLVPIVLAVVLVGVLWWWRPGHGGRFAAAFPVIVTLLVAADLLIALGSINTVVDRDAEDLTTPSHLTAIDALEPGERMAGEGRVFFANTGQTTGLDDVRGNLFTPPGWRELYGAVDGDHFRSPGTVANPHFRDVDISSHALDRMGVGVWAADPFSPIVGERRGQIDGGDRVRLEPGTAVVSTRLVVPAGGLRAIGLDVLEGAAGTLRADLRAGDGRAVAIATLDGQQRRRDLAVVSGSLPVGALIEAVFTFDGPGSGPVVAADDKGIAFETVAGGNGITVVGAGDVILYDRGVSVSARVVFAVTESLHVVATDHLRPLDSALVAVGDAESLGLPQTPPAGAVAVASVRHAAGGELIVDVNTNNPGLVVIPQPDYPGWTATVNGVDTDIVRVDAAFPAVSVPAGESVVEFQFRPSYLNLALALTLLSVVALIGTWWVGGKNTCESSGVAEAK